MFYLNNKQSEIRINVEYFISSVVDDVIQINSVDLLRTLPNYGLDAFY